MIRDNVLSMLGIAAKAGRVASGEYQTENMVKSGKSHLVIVAEDASDNTKKTFRNKCEFYETAAKRRSASEVSRWPRVIRAALRWPRRPRVRAVAA